MYYHEKTQIPIRGFLDFQQETLFIHFFNPPGRLTSTVTTANSGANRLQSVERTELREPNYDRQSENRGCGLE